MIIESCFSGPEGNDVASYLKKVTLIAYAPQRGISILGTSQHKMRI